MQIAVGLLLGIMGAGMAFFWASFLSAGKLNRGWRTTDGENYIVWHIAAELLTASACLISGVALVLDLEWGTPLGLIASGLLAYASINSLAWTKNSRLITSIMVTGATIAVLSAVYLLI